MAKARGKANAPKGIETRKRGAPRAQARTYAGTTGTHTHTTSTQTQRALGAGDAATRGKDRRTGRLLASHES